jgi:N utilization substance protein A
VTTEAAYSTTDDGADLSFLDGPPASSLYAVTAELVQQSADVAVMRLPDGSSAVMPVTEFYPNRRWTEGGRYHVAVLPTARPVCSTTRPELLELLAAGLIPELRDGSVRIMCVARTVGVRSKIAVAATQEGVDAVGAMLGRAANRSKALSRMLLGERIDIVAYHPEPLTFLRNALGVSIVETSTTDEGRLRVIVPAHQFNAAVGGGGLNAALASRLTGVNCSIVSA